MFQILLNDEFHLFEYYLSNDDAKTVIFDSKPTSNLEIIII